MHRYIAFLRAINVSGRNVKMARLRSLFEALGFVNVESFIASGNIIFEAEIRDTAAMERRIEAHLAEALGYEVATFLRSAEEVAEIAAYRPFAEPPEGEHTLSVAFLGSPPGDEARERLMGFRTEIDDLHVHGREVYWLCRTRMQQSSVSGAVLERALGMPATLRNVTTVRRLAAKYPPLR